MPAPKRLGAPNGAKQRLGVHRTIAKPPGRSDLGHVLVGFVKEGKLSAGEVGEVASASNRAEHSDIAKLAKARGKTTGETKHSMRSLMKTMGDDCVVLPPVYIAQTKFWNPSTLCNEDSDLAFLPIHETLDALIATGEENRWCAFSAAQQGFKDVLHAWAASLSIALMGQLFACIGLWGDSAPSTKKESLYLLLFTVLNGEFRQRFWITCFNKTQVCRCGCFGRCTFEAVFNVVAWSFRALLVGEYPAFDHTGTPFAKDSYRGRLAGRKLKIYGACIAKYGDWAWFKQALGLRGWQGEGPKGKICWMCNAGFHDEMNCYDFSLSADWRSTVQTMSSWWARVFSEGNYVSPIWTIPGFKISFCSPDFMHTSCLGILQYLDGNIMWELFRELGGTQRSWTHACGLLENMMKVAAKTLGLASPFHSLTIGMVRPSKSKPKMKLKAAEGRHFLTVLRHMLANFFRVLTRTMCCDSIAWMHCGAFTKNLTIGKMGASAPVALANWPESI
jgi:hypothetical protein